MMHIINVQWCLLNSPGVCLPEIYLIKIFTRVRHNAYNVYCCCYVASVVFYSVRPHRRQPTRLPRPWDSPGKNTTVGCRFLLQCLKVKVKSLSHVGLLATPWTAAYPAPLPVDFPGKSTGVGENGIVFIYIYIYISERAMAPHSSILAWKTPWTEEPGGLQSMWSQSWT